jgi:hypothetical protein
MNISLKSLAATIFMISSSAHAENTPCSQSKGGINHCMGSHFVCNDGSMSQSRKDCNLYFHGDGGAKTPPSAKPTDKP